MSSFSEKLKSLGLTLPEISKPVANYLNYSISEGKIYISGQLPRNEKGEIIQGIAGDSVSIEKAKEAAKLSALSLIAQLDDALSGNINKVKKCIRLGIFVNSKSGFDQHSSIANGASDLIVDIFGESGKHARTSIGVSSLPLGAVVEVEGLFEISSN